MIIHVLGNMLNPDFAVLKCEVRRGMHKLKAFGQEPYCFGVAGELMLFFAESPLPHRSNRRVPILDSVALARSSAGNAWVDLITEALQDDDPAGICAVLHSVLFAEKH